MKSHFLKNVALFMMLLSCFAVNGQSYKRIISLAPSLTKDIHLLQVQDRLVGITNYCELDAKVEVPIVASAVDVNIERIITQQPDLIIATSLTSTETLEMMKQLGLKVKFFPLPKSFEEINDQFLELGILIGKPELASQIVNKAQKRIEVLKLDSHLSETKIFMQIGTNPLFCVIPNTFLNDYINFIDGTNIASDLRNGAISRESVILRDPDIIIIVTMGTIGEEETRIWNSYPHLSAVKSNRIFVIDSEKACSPTPINFVETMEEIISKIAQNK